MLLSIQEKWAICHTWLERPRRLPAHDRPICAICGWNDAQTDRSSCAEHDAIRGGKRGALLVPSAASWRLRRPSGRWEPVNGGPGRQGLESWDACG